jgi:hypothetical protein
MISEKSYDWKIEGDYFDGCNCKNICPCIFALEPTEGDCKGLAAWHIEKDYFTNGTKNDWNNTNTNNKDANNNSINLLILMLFVQFMLQDICLLGRSGRLLSTWMRKQIMIKKMH